jgi:hypothetical protein
MEHQEIRNLLCVWFHCPAWKNFSPRLLQGLLYCTADSEKDGSRIDRHELNQDAGCVMHSACCMSSTYSLMKPRKDNDMQWSIVMLACRTRIEGCPIWKKIHDSRQVNSRRFSLFVIHSSPALPLPTGSKQVIRKLVNNSVHAWGC